MDQFYRAISIPILCALILAGCSSPGSATIGPPSATPIIELTETKLPETASSNKDLPAAVEYNIGETTIIQSNFPQDSRFREMPVSLNGIIAVPPGDDGPYPVVMIFHGNHPGCPIPDGDEVDRWPCAPEAEQPNYRGFDYLVRQLAAAGYVALSVNINAENTFGFGEAPPGMRLEQLVDLHLKALAEAAAGGANEFGVELEGRADLRRLAFFGHSRGGGGAYWLAHNLASSIDTDRGYGPVAGVLLIAPAAIIADTPDTRLPMATILPACDGDVTLQEGQYFYEVARFSPEQNQSVSSVWLENANHNYFNQILGDDFIAQTGRPDCEKLLDPERQRTFLVDYAKDFLVTLFSLHPQAVVEAFARLGLDSRAPAPGELYGLPASLAVLAPRPERLRLLVPTSEAELQRNLADGKVTAEGATTFYCPGGYYTPMSKPGSEPCLRVNLPVAGHPAMVVLSWRQSGGALRFELPEASRDLSGFSAVHLRGAVDPLSSLNASGSPQRLSVRLTDRAGRTASVSTQPDEPALQFPLGSVEEDQVFEGGIFSGRAPMTSIRLPLSDFGGIDLAEVVELAFVFDQTPSGSLLVGDIELIE